MIYLEGQSLFAKHLVNGVSDIVYMLDLENNRLEFLNSRAADTLYHAAAYDRKNGYAIFNNALHPDDHIRRTNHIDATRQLKEGEAKGVELRLKVKDGSYQWFHITDFLFSSEPEKSGTHLAGIIRPSGLVAARDTENNTSENKDLSLLLSNKNRELQFLHSELQTFTTVVAQDYLETLRQVYISLEMIISAEAHQFSNPSKAHLRRAQSMLQRLNLLTKDIVSYAAINPPAGKIETVNLNEIIDTVTRDLDEKIRAANATIHCTPLPDIKGYPLLLSVLFNHLLVNSLKFREPDRDPEIHIYHEWLEGKDISNPESYPGKSYHKIAVKDNGIGFNPADREKIFEIFYQGHNRPNYKGSGTGLAIARKIMDIHGGFIAAGTTPGKGSEFCCYFIV